jgi:hypothetical protein
MFTDLSATTPLIPRLSVVTVPTHDFLPHNSTTDLHSFPCIIFQHANKPFYIFLRMVSHFTPGTFTPKALAVIHHLILFSIFECNETLIQIHLSGIWPQHSPITNLSKLSWEVTAFPLYFRPLLFISMYSMLARQLTLCHSYLNPYCMGRKTVFFQRAFKFMHYTSYRSPLQEKKNQNN